MSWFWRPYESDDDDAAAADDDDDDDGGEDDNDDDDDDGLGNSKKGVLRKATTHLPPFSPGKQQ